MLMSGNPILETKQMLMSKEQAKQARLIAQELIGSVNADNPTLSLHGYRCERVFHLVEFSVELGPMQSTRTANDVLFQDGFVGSFTYRTHEEKDYKPLFSLFS